MIVSPNCDRADFPRREPLAAVEPLGVSPLSALECCGSTQPSIPLEERSSKSKKLG